MSAATPLPPQLLHDLRSPLNQIIGYAELLAEVESATAPDLQRISAAGHRMLALLEEHFISSGGDVISSEAAGVEETAPLHEQMRVEPGLILVVDDESGNRDLLTRLLTRQGHSVDAAATGADALRLMREIPFDVVLLDILMPDLDGYAVLNQIKSDPTLQHIPVIMISALNELQSVVRCIEAGAEDYLAKPFNPTLLKARIGACLEKKRGRDRESRLFAQLQENYKRMQEVEQLRDDMRSMIVHDLRTPLTAVIVGVQMLEQNGTLNPLQQRLISIAAGGGRTLLAMINDLLDVEKMESGGAQLQYEELTASALIAAAVEQVAALAEDGEISLLTEVAPGLPPFPGDANKLSRTLVNLIANAIKFTTGAGVVTITARQHGDDLHFAVRDTGGGIPPEAFERIFEKFGQLAPGARVGTGLGLAFCKLAVEAHGGRITVDSAPAVGSTFSFTVPLVRLIAEEAAAPQLVTFVAELPIRQ